MLTSGLKELENWLNDWDWWDSEANWEKSLYRPLKAEMGSRRKHKEGG
jgi:hypothetical protein